MSEKFGEFLNERRLELSRQRGLKYDLIRWRELAKEAEIPETNLARWQSGVGTPDMNQLPKLAKVFGEGVYTALDMEMPIPKDASPALRWLIRNRNTPAVRAKIEEIKRELGPSS